MCELLQEYEEDGCNEASERNEMVPLQGLSLEEDNSEDRKDSDGDNLLDDFELHQRKSAAIANKTHTVCRNLTSVLKERQEPANEYNNVERSVV